MASADPARVERLERQVAFLLRHLGLDPQPFGGAPGVPAEPADPPGLLAAVDSGKIIVAIKIYRARTGVSLAEATKAAEGIARSRR